ncbi:4-(cytidine 5'-diphospho)-2-C-methyl-D-erythritol kinase [Clostridium culturomicium]|uniref:4-(cytidine 5'-diphospho)-2-C-methyl-D-erythritol kinase n=1 Tax=Clostridium culturomicium TaxID=1499683 RepID=UPI00058EFE32|nr:4-(cytidine 5'-diphospho)-2-C-methyl-D-erythritol kinase [Clostridium culturomicium]
MKVKAYGKINIALDVIGKRDDGYHLLKMIMQTVNIYDELELKKSAKGIKITSNKSFVPTDNRNLVYKAIELFCNTYSVEKAISVHIEKNIPVEAGMAGGSTDAAAALRAMRDLYKPEISDKELMELGVKIGADVPYCIKGGTALCEGIGEVITELKPFKDKLLVVVKPNFGVSTIATYKGFKLSEVKQHPKVDELIEAMNRDDLKYVADNMMNLLELVTLKEHEEISRIKEFMCAEGALGSMMSGSGPTVFGFFDSEEKANKCAEMLKDKYKEVFVTSTI